MYWIPARFAKSTALVTGIGRLLMYRSPTIVVHPFVLYSDSVAISEIGNAAQRTPLHVAHCDVHTGPSSNSVHPHPCQRNHNHTLTDTIHNRHPNSIVIVRYQRVRLLSPRNGRRNTQCRVVGHIRPIRRPRLNTQQVVQVLKPSILCNKTVVNAVPCESSPYRCQTSHNHAVCLSVHRNKRIRFSRDRRQMRKHAQCRHAAVIDDQRT